MARAALLASLRRAYKITQTSLKTGIPADEIVDILQQKTTRRRLIKGLGLASAISAVICHDSGDSAVSARIPKVLVVGAGIAGLVAAYRLVQAGVPVDIALGKKPHWRSDLHNTKCCWYFYTCRFRWRIY